MGFITSSLVVVAAAAAACASILGAQGTLPTLATHPLCVKRLVKVDWTDELRGAG